MYHSVGIFSGRASASFLFGRQKAGKKGEIRRGEAASLFSLSRQSDCPILISSFPLLFQVSFELVTLTLKRSAGRTIRVAL